jgi:hypothetical protein
LRFALGLLVGVVLSFATRLRADQAVRVQAQSVFDGVTRVATTEGVEIRGRLLDDTERPIGAASIELETSTGRARWSLIDCKGQRPLKRRVERRQVFFAIASDVDGAFCARIVGARPEDELTMSLGFSGGPFHLGARLPVPPLVPLIQLSLAFEAPSVELTLDRARHSIKVSVSAEPAPPASLAPVALELLLVTTAKESSVARGQWSPGAPFVEFDVASDALGAPGPARLVARFTGSGALAPARAEAVALRIAPVHLTARVERRDADGALIDVTSPSVGGLSAPGWVEAHSGGERIAATSLTDGAAQLAIELGASDRPTHMTLSYRGDDPWWVSGPPVEIVVPPGRTAPPLRWPWLALLVPIAYLFIRALQRPGVSGSPPPPKPPTLPVAEIEFLEAIPEASGWSGVVRDAHDATPVAGARISIVLPVPESQPLGPSTLSDAEGRFHLESVAASGATLTVSAASHSELTRPLPPEGRIGVALVSRRRTLMRRLVDWARAAGTPWAGVDEPTPGEVFDVALRREEPRVAEWAHGIELAAFGKTPPDEQQEASLRALEPTWGEKGDRKR